MPITNYTNKEQIDLFRQAAEDHTAVNWFDAGPKEFIFSNNTDLIFPAVYIQTTGEELALGRKETSYAVYVFDKPLRDTQVDNQAFQYDSNIATARDTAFQILKDVLETVKNGNLQNFTLTVDGAIALSDREHEGEVGYSSLITIAADCII